jgi:hypothetical protein
MNADRRRRFDPTEKQRFFNDDEFGLRRSKDRFKSSLNYLDEMMIWHWAVMNLPEIACGYIVGARDDLLTNAFINVNAWAKLSIRRQEWKGREIFASSDQSTCSQMLPARPEAWLQANLVCIVFKWFELNKIDQQEVSNVLNSDIDGLLAIQGAESSLDLLPLSAWQEIISLTDLLGLGGERRNLDASGRIAVAFARDPSQLHDPRSPARARARRVMRSYAEIWLSSGHATTAMNWLRTIEWREGQSGLSPREVMLRAYAYMPEVEPPPTIANEVNQLRKIPI